MQSLTIVVFVALAFNYATMVTAWPVPELQSNEQFEEVDELPDSVTDKVN